MISISINYNAHSRSKERARDWAFINQIEVTEVVSYGFGVYMIHFRYKTQNYTLSLAHTDNSEVTHDLGEDVPKELHKLSVAIAWEAGDSALYVTLTNGDDLIFKNIKWTNTEEEEE